MNTIPLPTLSCFGSDDDTARILAELPPLPSLLRYYDDFMDTERSVRDLDQDVWRLVHDGKTDKLDFAWVDSPLRPLLKHWIICCIANNLDCDTVRGRLYHLQSACSKLETNLDLLRVAISVSPPEFRSFWLSVIEPITSAHEAAAVRAFLHALCEMSIGPWMPGLGNFVSKLPCKTPDKFRVVRTGDCFVPMDQQARIIDYLDDLVFQVSSTSCDLISTNALRDSCILIIAFQYAFRNGQIARIKNSDVRAFNTGAVHLSVALSKKLRIKDRVKVNRRVKREWCPIFTEYQRRRSLAPPTGFGVPVDSFFGLKPAELGFAISRLLLEVTGEAWSGTDLRHTAAQRQADAGASQLSLAEFMGHSSVRIGEVYYDTSPTQAQQVNNALAISPIYSVIAEVARTRVIDVETLLGLPEDHQIGGAPHGIAISGIGGCQAGQSNCQKNPILACYDCRKFMPLNDPAVHRAVVDDLRGVTLEFVHAAKGESGTPAYTQLRRTLEAAQRVAADLEAASSVAAARPIGDDA